MTAMVSPFSPVNRKHQRLLYFKTDQITQRLGKEYPAPSSLPVVATTYRCAKKPTCLRLLMHLLPGLTSISLSCSCTAWKSHLHIFAQRLGFFVFVLGSVISSRPKCPMERALNPSRKLLVTILTFVLLLHQWAYLVFVLVTVGYNCWEILFSGSIYRAFLYNER